LGEEEVWKDGKDAEAGELGAEEGARMERRQIQEDFKVRIEKWHAEEVWKGCRGRVKLVQRQKGWETEKG
jgi:hypothetical protein